MRVQIFLSIVIIIILIYALMYSIKSYIDFISKMNKHLTLYVIDNCEACSKQKHILPFGFKNIKHVEVQHKYAPMWVDSQGKEYIGIMDIKKIEYVLKNI
jgi:hypothetical protein